MQNTKVLNKKVDKKDEILFLSREAMHQGKWSVHSERPTGTGTPTQPNVPLWLPARPCSGSPGGLCVLLKGLSLLQQLSKAVKNMTWLLKTASFSY